MYDEAQHLRLHRSGPVIRRAEAAVKRRGSSNFSAWMAEHVNMPTGLRHIQRIS
jgi:hypothetical protein